MRLGALLVVCLLLLTAAVFGAAAKSTPANPANFRFSVTPAEPSNPPEIGGSMFQAAAATTTVLAWYQFDNANHTPNKQGWTEKDMTVQVKMYWHVAGASCSDPIAPVNGQKSMWCGQWPTTLDPWCGWAALPGYGNNWDQSLETTVNNATTVAYKIAWESEAGYDFTYAEWWNGTAGQWTPDAAANAGAGAFDGTGGPLSETLTSPYGATKFRFHFVSDGAFCDEDGLSPTAEGAVKVDDLSINGGLAEDWEGEACGAQQSTDGKWVAAIPTGFGLYSNLISGTLIVQEDPCEKPLSYLWAWFDNPLVTNYACGGWPLQGAMPYGPNDSGLYMQNEIWSPWIPVTGSGNSYALEFLTYRDLPLDNLQFYRWAVRWRDTGTAGGCPSIFYNDGLFWYGGGKDWVQERFQFGAFIPANATDLQVALGAYDMCGSVCGIYGTGSCHSHAPLIDQVKVTRVSLSGPQWVRTDGEMFQDNFPDNGNVTPTSYARCDMAWNIIPQSTSRFCAGDSLAVVVTDPSGLASDNTGGRSDTKAVYLFVRVTDRFGNPVPGKNGTAIQSPDDRRYSGDPQSGLLRYPFVTGLAPSGWDTYRCDLARSAGGGEVKDTFCADLMDISAFLQAGWHANENAAANVGIFAPGDVIHYFLGARNTAGSWSYCSRTLSGQGEGFQTNNINQCTANPMEWSVLPDAGRQPGDLGDILFVDGFDGNGGQDQLYFDLAFRYLNIEDRVDRYDILYPATNAWNSLATRVKNVQAQMIGDGPTEIYQKVLWNTNVYGEFLMGEHDFALAYTFLTYHPDNPGWAYWGDDVAEDWANQTGTNAVNVKSTYMNHTLVGGDQKMVTGIVSPRVFAVSATPWAPETFYAYGGCPMINDFDMPGAAGASMVTHRYNNQTNAPAALYQATPNAMGTAARFFLAGFGFEYIRDDELDGVPDYAPHLRKTLLCFENSIDDPVGIDPLAFANSLADNYPNPFNPTTTIKYSIASAGRVTLRIYNASGQLVRTLVDEEQIPAPGGFAVTWNGTNDRGEPAASGVYFYQITATGFSQTKKLVLLK